MAEKKKPVDKTKPVENPKLPDNTKLEEYLKAKGVKLTVTDPKPYFEAYTAILQEDKVTQTPTCVIIDQGKKATFVNAVEIPKALELLR